MAANEQVVQVLHVTQPKANAATWHIREGGSTPGEIVPIAIFDAASDQYLDVICRLATTYSGRGLKVVFAWTATSATTGDVRWGVGLRRMAGGEDIDTSHSYSFKYATVSVAETNGALTESEVTFEDGTEMDNLAASDYFILRLLRNGSDAADRWNFPQR